ncbi:MAG: UvrD-helicase domain-containing protein [Aquincola sp.]|nr:UvrD-helicase domain-containing protein [Aquincola sp.]MDH5330326.1 UvrD-helicase domain-containing protein [Aquincola sp.]
MTGPAYTLDGAAATRDRFYSVACDPRRHVVVEACAGAGKTWMLVSRIVRALLGGTPAQEILAITFTRKAAGEMRTRLAEWLDAFSRLSPDEAAAELRLRGVAAPDAATRAGTLIGLQERVLVEGRAVEVHTFHAWFLQLLQAAPLDLLASLGLAPGLALVEDIDDHRPELMRSFHAAVRSDADRLADYRLLSQRHGRAMLSRWLSSALDRRAEIELADEAGTLAASIDAGSAVHPASRVRDAAFAARVEFLAQSLSLRGKKLSDEAAHGLVDAMSLADDRDAFGALRAAMFTDGGAGTPRKQLGDLTAQQALCEELDRMADAVAQFEAHGDHVAMVRLSRVLFAHYAALKQRRGLVDMADLERVALALLADHTLSGWVQERLDARVSHLLIDEFQDTSPLQWHALHAWLSSYAGAGADGPRLFIVGDPKQSIYRFRRAEPRVFEAAQRFVVQALGGTLAACDHTRRCAPAVVDAINAVFGSWPAPGGVSGWRPHTTQAPAASGPAALAALPAPERVRAARGREEGEPARVWRPSLTMPRHEPQAVIREAEAATVALAIDALVRGEGVEPGAIMVLARRREPLRLLARALATHHLPFVAPEDMPLASLAEAQDLLAVIDVLASPGQSLSLARALRSPLFGVSDGALLDLAARARAAGGWWPALMRIAGEPAGASPEIERAARLFSQWRRAAATLPPHDLLDRIVHEGELLPRLVAAVPPAARGRAVDAVHALLATALALDGARFATPYNFVRALRRRRIEAPRATQSDAVQLLTIHGAKGLEARIVFLMDTEPETPRSDTATLLVDWPVEAKWPRRAAFIAAEARCPPSLRVLLADETAAREREEANALYVALTRAEQRIVVSRTPPHQGSAAGSWWQRLQPHALAWTPEPPPRVAAAHDAAELVSLPILAPRPEIVESTDAADDAAARLGQAVHRWLEWASHDARADRTALAQAAASAFGVADAGTVAAAGARILDSPVCRHFFDPTVIAWAANEVPIASDGGELRRIDRLVRLAGPDGGCWWVLDYKVAAAPGDDPDNWVQLGAYRDAVARLVPGEPVRAAFITGRGELVELAP